MIVLGQSCFAANTLQVDIMPGQALLVEIILTAFLLFVVCAAADSNKSNQVGTSLYTFLYRIGIALVDVTHFIDTRVTKSSSYETLCTRKVLL